MKIFDRAKNESKYFDLNIYIVTVLYNNYFYITVCVYVEKIDGVAKRGLMN